MRLLASIPSRPGAAAAFQVADLNVRHGILRVGKDKTGGERWLPLPTALVEELAGNVTGRKPHEPLVARPGGKAWDKDAWYDPIRRAALRAGLPVAVNAYALRHSVITDLVVGGLDLMTVAKLANTSVVMIEKHYGHLRGELAVQALARVGLSPPPPADE